MRNPQDKRDTGKSKNYGFEFGALIGAAIGGIDAGPHFREWPFISSVGTLSAWTIGIALLFYFAMEIFNGYSIDSLARTTDIPDHDPVDQNTHDGSSGVDHAQSD